jgi:hypothetical protein
MSDGEFEFWAQTFAKEYIGDEREDYRFARLEAAICNFAGKTLKDDVTVKPSDCMPYIPKPKSKPKRWTRKGVHMQTLSTLKAVFAAHGLQEAAARQQQKLDELSNAAKK